MGLEMGFEARELGKRLTAHLTAKWLWAKVKLHVVAQVSLPRERL